MKQVANSLTAKDYLSYEKFRGHKCRNCSHVFNSSADIYAGYTKEHHRVAKCESCMRYNIMRVGEDKPHLVSRREEHNLKMKRPLTEYNVNKVLTGLFCSLIGIIITIGVLFFTG